MVGLLLGTPFIPVQGHAGCDIKKFGELPVSVQGGRVLFNGSIDGQNAKFIVDSGAFYSSLTNESAARFGLTVSQLRSGINLFGVGGRVDAHQTTVKSLVVPGLAGATLSDVEFLVFGNAFAGESDGLLGENVLGAADTEYDINEGVIRLMRSRGCDNTKMAYWSASNDFGMLSLGGRTELHSLVRAHATLNGTSLEVLFDTGAPQSVLSMKAAERAGVDRNSPGVIPGGVSHGLGPEVTDTYIGKFQSFSLGGEEIKNIALRFGLKDRAADQADMLLGLDFFRSHRIYIAKNQNRMFFTYNGTKLFDLSVLREAEQNMKSDPPSETQAASSEPALSSVEEYRKRAAAHVANKQFDLAIDDYGSARALKPDDAELPLLSGRLRLATQDLAGAATDFREATRLSPQNPTLRLQIAYAYEGTRNFVPAIEQFNQWIEKYPSDDRVPRVLHERCWCRAALGVELEQAMLDCNQAIERHNDDSQARVNRGLVSLRLGKRDSAIGDFTAAITKQPKSPWALFGRGIAESRNGDPAHAKQDLEAAMALDATVAAQFRALGLEPSL